MPTLRRGSKGETVIHLQTRLNFLGYGPLKADGDFGPDTEKAVKKFQQSHNHVLGVDGIVGPDTWRILDDAHHGTPTLRRGSKGEFVKRLQIELNGRDFGYGPLKVDGDFGPDTEKAVKKFQQSHNHVLGVDGIVGPDTWGVLLSAVA